MHDTKIWTKSSFWFLNQNIWYDDFMSKEL